MSKPLILPTVSTKYGAPLGYDNDTTAPAGKLRLVHVPLVDGGYLPNGTYFGLPSNIYCATDEVQHWRFTRAASRAEAAASLGLSSSQLQQPL